MHRKSIYFFRATAYYGILSTNKKRYAKAGFSKGATTEPNFGLQFTFRMKLIKSETFQSDDLFFGLHLKFGRKLKNSETISK